MACRREPSATRGTRCAVATHSLRRAPRHGYVSRTEVTEPRMDRQGKGLSLNVSSGGMLLLMDHQPKVNQVLRIHVPTPVTIAKTPTLAEVRWTRKIPFETFYAIHFVGLKFMLSGA